MKITFVTSTLISGGAERVISLLANNFSQKGYQVEIICLRKQIVFYPINENVRVVFAEVESIANFLPLKMLWLRNYIKRTHPNVVIPFMERIYCVTLLALWGMSVPIISSERNDPRQASLIKKVLRRLLLWRTTALVVQTESVKSYFPEKIQRRTKIIYNPVSDNVFNIKPMLKLKQIVSVGRLYSQKNQKMLINAFYRVSRKFPDYTLIIYGEGPLRGELQQQIDSLSLSHRVFLLGRSHEIFQAIAQSEIFCMSSDYEGMSNALLEAVCLGMPIVTTDVSGVRELINDGIDGLVVPVRETEKMAAALERLLSDKQMQNNFTNRIKEKAENFRIEKIVSQWEQLILEVVRDNI